MVDVAILYYSGFGHTEIIAKSVAEGLEQEGAQVRMVKAVEATADPSLLEGVDAIVFGTPTYMGGVAADFKAFMDNTTNIWFARNWKDKIAAGFTNSGSMSGDKFNTLMQLFTFAMQHGMIWVGQDELDSSPNNKKGDASAINRIGSHIGVMAQSDDESPAHSPPEGDKETARLLGVRVAKCCKSFKYGASD